MLNRKIRNLAATAATIASATVLVVLGTTTGASASTIPLCSGGAPRACIQVTGSGTTVDAVSGWIWNNTSSELANVHVELYTTHGTNLSPTGANSVPLTVGGPNGTGNCGSPNLAPGRNSPPCNGGGFQYAGFLCAAAWQLHSNGHYYTMAYRCVLVW